MEYFHLQSLKYHFITMYKNKSTKKYWIEVVPKLSLVIPQTLQQAIHYMNHLPLFFVFYLTDNHELICKQVG